jgi:hypothetical protein
MRIRNVVRFHLRVDDATFPGFLLIMGRNRMPASAWEVYPENVQVNPLLWKGRYCYLCMSQGTLTFFNGKTFQLSRHVK